MENTSTHQFINPVSIKRLVPGLIIGPASWLGPYIVSSSLFLPAMLQHIDASRKVELVALFSTVAMIAAALSNMVAGALSDRTRSRFGKRTPWILAGGLGFMLTLFMAAAAPNIPFLLVAWVLSSVALNFVVAPMVAWIDLAPEDNKGTASGAYGGLGMALGNNGFNIIGAMFLSQFRLGFIIFGAVSFIGILIATLIVHEPSNLDEEIPQREKKERRSFKEIMVIFPSWHIGRDYYLGLMGKIFQGIGNFAITGYLLYIMTDFMHKSTGATQSSIQIINTIMLIFGIAMGFVAGPISDRFKLLKLPVGLSAISLAVGALMMFFFRNNVGIIVYALLAGFGMGL